MESDNFSVSSRRDSIDADRASLEAGRQNLYDDQDNLSPQTVVQSPKVRELEASELSQSYSPAFRSRSTAPEILDAGPAPPDYLSATAGRSVAFQSDSPSFNDNGYGAITNTASQAPEVSDRIPEWQSSPEISLSRQASRSWLASILSPRRNMGKPQFDVHRTSHVEEEQIGLFTNAPTRRTKGRKCCHLCCHISLVLGVILFLGLLIGVFDDQGGSGDMPVDNPSKPPIGGDHGKDGYVPHPATPQCPYASESDPLQFDFADPSQFSFIERIQYDDDLYGKIGGYVWLVPASDEEALGMDSNIRVWVSLATTEPWKVEQISYARDDYGLEIKFPRLKRTDLFGLGRSCMHIAAVIMFKRDVSLDSLNITSTHLDLKALDDFSDFGLDVDTMNADLVAGDLSMHYWSSRETHLHTISGRITGRYALHDVLNVNTKSGNIDILVDPKDPESKYEDTPAIFTAKSVSGNINAVFPKSGYIPERVYKTTLTGVSSVITGSYLLSARACLLSHSGNIKTILLPFSSSTAVALHSESVSGNQDLTILPPYKDPGSKMDKFKSEHETVSGTVKLQYPQEWSGKLEASTMSGNVRLKGRDLIVDREGGSVWGAYSAHKGKGDSHIDIETLSGNVEAIVGDLE